MWSRRSLRRNTVTTAPQPAPEMRGHRSQNLSDAGPSTGNALQLTTSRSANTELRGFGAGPSEDVWASVAAPAYKLSYPLHNPYGPRWYKNHHLLPPALVKPSMRPPTFFSPSFPPISTNVADADDPDPLPAVPKSPLPTPASSQTRVTEKPRSRKTSQSTPDNVDLLDGTDPWGSTWHHTSPYDIFTQTTNHEVRHSNFALASNPANFQQHGARPRRASISTPQGHTNVAPSPLWQSSSAVNLPSTAHKTQIHVPRKLSKRKTSSQSGNAPDIQPTPATKPQAVSAPPTPIDMIYLSGPNVGDEDSTTLPKRMSVGPPLIQPPVTTTKKERRGSMLDRLVKKFSLLRKSSTSPTTTAFPAYTSPAAAPPPASIPMDLPIPARSDFQHVPEAQPERDIPDTPLPTPPAVLDQNDASPRDQADLRDDQSSIISLELSYSIGRLTVTNPDLFTYDPEPVVFETPKKDIEIKRTLTHTVKAKEFEVKPTFVDEVTSEPEEQGEPEEEEGLPPVPIVDDLEEPQPPPSPPSPPPPQPPHRVVSRLDKPLPPPGSVTPARRPAVALDSDDSDTESTLSSSSDESDDTDAYWPSQVAPAPAAAPPSAPAPVAVRVAEPEPIPQPPPPASVAEPEPEPEKIEVLATETPSVATPAAPSSPQASSRRTSISTTPTEVPRAAPTPPPSVPTPPIAPVVTSETQAHLRRPSARSVKNVTSTPIPADLMPKRNGSMTTRVMEISPPPSKTPSPTPVFMRKPRSVSRSGSPAQVPAQPEPPAPTPIVALVAPTLPPIYLDSPLTTTSILANPPTPWDHRISIAASTVPPSLPEKDTHEEKEMAKPPSPVSTKTRQTEVFKLVRSSSGNVYASGQTIVAAGEQWEVVEDLEGKKRKDKPLPPRVSSGVPSDTRRESPREYEGSYKRSSQMQTQRSSRQMRSYDEPSPPKANGHSRHSRHSSRQYEQDAYAEEERRLRHEERRRTDELERRRAEEREERRRAEEREERRKREEREERKHKEAEREERRKRDDDRRRKEEREERRRREEREERKRKEEEHERKKEEQAKREKEIRRLEEERRERQRQEEELVRLERQRQEEEQRRERRRQEEELARKERQRQDEDLLRRKLEEEAARRLAAETEERRQKEERRRREEREEKRRQEEYRKIQEEYNFRKQEEARIREENARREERRRREERSGKTDDQDKRRHKRSTTQQTSESSELERNSSTATRPTSELPSAAEMNAMRAKDAWELERLWKARSMYGGEEQFNNFIHGPGSTSSKSDLSDDTPISSGNHIYHSMPLAPPPVIYPSPASIPSIPDSLSTYDIYDLPPARPNGATTKGPSPLSRPPLNNPLPVPPKESAFAPAPIRAQSGYSSEYWSNYSSFTTAT